MLAYATVEDLTDSDPPWLATVPDNAPQLLRSASFVVAEAAQRSYTDVPSAEDAAPLRDATCAQVAAWATAGIDPYRLGLDPASAPVKKSSILSADIERDTSAQAKAALAALTELCGEARQILYLAGLLWVPIPLSDMSGYLPSWGLDHRPSWIDVRFGALAEVPLGDWWFTAP
jgi:hypothetical protein